MEFSTLNGYKVKDKKAVRYYDDVESMKADTSLKSGMHVITKGYYSVNDGGGSEYHITNTASQSDYQEELNNNLYATLVINDCIKPEMIGAYADGEHDDSLIIQSILDKHIDLSLNKKTYKIETPLTIHKNISIYGNNATIVYDGDGYAINYVNPESDNNWDLFEQFYIKDLIFNGDCDGAIQIDRFHYPKLDNIRVENNNSYAFKIKTSYWGSYSDIHVQNCNGGGFQLCGTQISGGTTYTGSNQNTFINCSILNFNKSGDFYGIKITDRSNQNNYNQITIQNSKTDENDYGTGLFIKNAVNNTFFNFYAENQKVNVMIESGDDGSKSQATFYSPYFGIDTPTQCCLYCKDSVANIYNPYYYENQLQDGYDRAMFISHHTSGHNSFVYLETDKPLETNSNKLLEIYDGTTYTNYKAIAPTSGNFGIVFEKAPYNHNTLNLIFRSDTNPLYVDNMKVTSDTTNNYLQVYRWGMFGNQGSTYAIQPTLSGNLSNLPTSPVNGLKYFETNNHKTLTYYGGSWYYEDGTTYSS